MGIVLGYLSLVCFFVLAAKWIAKKCKLTSLDRFLMRIHKAVSLLLAVFCILHIVFVIPVWANRNLFVNISGIVAVVLMAFLIFLCHILKQKDRRMKWHRILTICMAACLVWHVVIYMIDFREYRGNVENITFEDIDLSEVKDGTYTGEYDAGYIYARVEVKMEDGNIISIKLLEHRNEKGKSAEKILDRIMKTQEIDADAVSGATYSSNVIKKAIENALTGS